MHLLCGNLNNRRTERRFREKRMSETLRKRLRDVEQRDLFSFFFPDVRH